jgi:choline dehydrogenase
MIYNRGTYRSQQAWANLVGDDAWTFDNLLPYFSRGITYSPANATLRGANASVPLPANPLAYNGTGPLHISHPNFAQIFASYIDEAMEESGIRFQQDFISGHLLGRQYAPLTIAYPEEERSSSQTSFLRAALHSGRTNLKVYPNMLAKRIVFNDTKTAMGVEVGGTLLEEHFRNLANFLLYDRSKRLLMAIQKLLF